MSWGLFAIVGITAIGGAFFLGRRFSADTQRARELEVVIEDLRKDHECALSELEVTRHELKRGERELERLRADLSDHFSGTADLLRGLSREYRAVCDHLAQGAELLCPERAAAIEASLTPELLAEGAEPALREIPRAGLSEAAATSPPPV